MPLKKKPFIATILSISLFQMGMVALAPVISSLTQAFPGTSALMAQTATTFLNLVLVLTALASGAISRKIGRRAMCALGMLLFLLAGVLGTLLTTALWCVFLWSAFLGAGTGLFVPAVSSMMIDCLEDSERGRIAGLQTAAVNLGGMLLSFSSGLLAAVHWRMAYLVFAAAAPVILLALKFIPRRSMEAQAPGGPERSRSIPRPVWLASLQTLVFAVLYFAFSTNISMLLVERGVTNSAMSGTVTAVFMLGGCLFGFALTTVLKLAKGKTPSLAFLLLALSYFIICLFTGLPALFLAAFIGGGSLSLIFPYFVVTIADRVDPSVSVISSSLIVSVAPNFGSFLSPLILTNLSAALFGERVVCRFLLAAILALLLAAVLFLISLSNSKKDME